MLSVVTPSPTIVAFNREARVSMDAIIEIVFVCCRARREDSFMQYE